jgi:hypothetical protein
MISNSEIRNRLADAFAGNSLEEFEDWFVRQGWNVHHLADLDLRRLVFAIELRFSERSSGHLGEADFREELKNLLQPTSVYVGAQPSAVSIESGSSSSFSLQPVLQIRPVDIPRVTVSV